MIRIRAYSTATPHRREYDGLAGAEVRCECPLSSRPNHRRRGYEGQLWSDRPWRPVQQPLGAVGFAGHSRNHPGCARGEIHLVRRSARSPRFGGPSRAGRQRMGRIGARHRELGAKCGLVLEYRQGRIPERSANSASKRCPCVIRANLTARRSLPALHHQQTSSSGRCSPPATCFSVRLFDYLVGAGDETWRDR
jgi:hypothetical protein